MAVNADNLSVDDEKTGANRKVVLHEDTENSIDVESRKRESFKEENTYTQNRTGLVVISWWYGKKDLGKLNTENGNRGQGDGSSEWMSELHRKLDKEVTVDKKL